MAFAGSISQDNIQKLIQKGLRTGLAREGNRCARFSENEKGVIETFHGEIIADGVFTFSYYDSDVLAVDFTNRWATDFGMSDYSNSTARTVDAVVWSLSKMCLMPRLYTLATLTGGADKGRRPWEKALLAQLREGAPWMSKSGSTWRYHWGARQTNDDEHYEIFSNASRQLFGDGEWRYFTYRWKDGIFQKEFIDEDAERRWNARRPRRKDP